ncbi:hypothetical protein GALL_08420 [mine drainage metagenome]|uniref:Uncharacterized protein n=1 Tax=mine drainage metagenome TaxID=410659 RepID=A0A1J5U1P9_9ZZZZ
MMSQNLKQEELSFRDWRNPNEYGMKDVSAEQWAWEFLRRNSEYHDDWHKYVGQCMAHCGISKDEAELSASDWMYMQMECEWGDGPSVFVPEIETNESIESWRKKHGSAAKNISLSRWLGNKWNLTQIADPKTDRGYWHFAPQPSFDYKVARNGILTDWGYHGIQEPPVEHLACEARIIFNLNLPIDFQIEHVRNHLLQLQQSLRNLGELKEDGPSRLRTDKYRIYLRILDAINSGVTLKEIGEVLQPWKSDDYSSGHRRTKAIEGQLKEARRLVDGGYKALLGKVTAEK